jgi:hypothetical protein
VQRPIERSEPTTSRALASTAAPECADIGDRPEMLKLVGVDHRAERLDDAVNDVERPHVRHAAVGVAEDRPPAVRSPGTAGHGYQTRAAAARARPGGVQRDRRRRSAPSTFCLADGSLNARCPGWSGVGAWTATTNAGPTRNLRRPHHGESTTVVDPCCVVAAITVLSRSPLPFSTLADSSNPAIRSRSDASRINRIFRTPEHWPTTMSAYPPNGAWPAS